MSGVDGSSGDCGADEASCAKYFRSTLPETGDWGRSTVKSSSVFSKSISGSTMMARALPLLDLSKTNCSAWL